MSKKRQKDQKDKKMENKNGMMYAKHLNLICQNTASFRSFLSPKEQLLLHNVISKPSSSSAAPSPGSSTSTSISNNTNISPTTIAFEIYEHLLLRKGRFFRTGALTKYLPTSEDNHDDDDHHTKKPSKLFLQAIAVLTRLNFISYPFAKGTTSNKDVLAKEILFSPGRCMLNKDELQKLAVQLGCKKQTGLSKQGLLDWLKKCSTSQKTLFGGTVSLQRPLIQIFASNSPLLPSTLIAVNPIPQALFHMMHRIYCLSSLPVEFNPKLELPVPNDGLMVLFEKQKYVDYTCNVDLRTIYTSRAQFNEFEYCLKLEQSSGIEIEINEECPNGIHCCCYSQNQNVIMIDDSDNDSDDILCVWDSKELNNNEAMSQSSLAPPPSSSSSSSSINTTLQNDLAPQCLLCATKTAFDMLQQGTNPPVPPSNVPPWLHHLYSGSICARIMWSGIAEYERQRHYTLAIEMILYLLNIKWSPKRRGRLWLRLLINLKHQRGTSATSEMKKNNGKDKNEYHTLVIEYCKNAINDIHVHGGDRIALEKKLKNAMTMTTVTTTKSITSTKSTTSSSSSSSSSTMTIATKSNTVVPPNTIVIDEDAYSSDFEPIKSTKKMKKQKKKKKKRKRVENQNQKQNENQNENNATTSNKNQIPQHTIIGRPTNSKTGQKSRFVDYGEGNSCTVEALCLEHYKVSDERTDHWYGVHCEGGPIKALYGLLMFDLLFDSTVPNVFLTPFQNAPLDLTDSRSSFIQNRQEKHDARLNEIYHLTDLELFHHIRSSWYDHFGIACRGVNWSSRFCDPRYLLTMGCALGGVTLSRMFATLSGDYHHFAGGLPDLLLWRIKVSPTSLSTASSTASSTSSSTTSSTILSAISPTTSSTVSDFSDVAMIELDLKKSNIAINDYHEHMEQVNIDVGILETMLTNGLVLEAKFVEVKGPRDTLMARQEAWLQVIHSASMEEKSTTTVEVCHVEEKTWSEKKKTKKK